MNPTAERSHDRGLTSWNAVPPLPSLTTTLVPLLAALLGVGGCGDSGSSYADGASVRTGSGILEAPAGPVDPALAERGERLFGVRQCTACHRVGGGRLVGPDLEGVTERRSFPWLYHMVTSPDSMLRHDPEAKELLGEYFTPMTDQGVTPQEFRAIYEYLRSEKRGDESG